MAVTVEAAFVLLDKASGPLKDIARQAKITDAALKGMGGGGGLGGAKQTTELNSFADALKKTRAAQDSATSSMKKASAEVDRHTRSLTPLGAAFRNVGVHIGNFGKQIENSTRSLLKQHPAIITSTKGLSGLGGAAWGAFSAFKVLPGIVAAFLPQIVSLAGAIGGLATSLIGAVGGGVAVGGGLLGSFVAGLGSIVAVAKPAVTQLTSYRTAVQNLTKAQETGNAAAIKSAQTQLDAISKTNPGVKELSQNISGMESAWKKATAPGRADFFRMANASISTLRKNLGGFANDANLNMSKTRSAIEKNLGPMMTALRGLEQGLSRVFRRNVGGFVGGFVNILKGLSNILKVIEPQLNGVGDGFEKLTARFAKWTGSAAGQKRISEMTDAFRQWVRLLGQVVRFIGIVTGAGMKTGTSEIKKWADRLQQVNDQLGSGKGQKSLENWFARTMQNTNKLWGPLKNLASSVLLLAKAWEPIGKVVQGILAKFPAPVLTGMLALFAGAKALGSAKSLAGKVGGPLEKFAGKGSTPANPLFVADVSGGLGGGLGGGGAKEGRLARWAEKGGVRGKIAGGLAKVGIGTEAGMLATTAERGGVLGKGASWLSGLGSLFKSRTGIGAAGGAAAGEQGMSLFARLTRGSGWHGIGGATGGFTGMAAAMALPMLGHLVPKKLAESGVGRWGGQAISGFLGGGMLGAGVQGINALLPSHLRKGGGTKAAVDVGMAASLGGTIAPALGMGMGPGAVIGAGLKAGSLLRNKVGGLGGRVASIGAETAAGAGAGALIGGPVGAAVGGAIGGAVGTAQAYNPFSAKGRKNIADDAKTVWNGIKTGAAETGKWVAKQAKYYNPFTAEGQRHIAQSAVKTWDTVKGGVTDAGKWVGRQAVKFNPFSESGRRNIANGAKSAWNGIKTAFAATGRWFAGVGKSISRPFVSAWNWVKNAAKNTFNWIKNAAKNVVHAIGDFFTKTPLGRWIMWPFKTAFNWVKNAARDTKNWIVGRFNDVVNFFKGLPGKIWGAIKGLGNTIARPFKDAWNWISGLPGRIWDMAKKIPGKIGEGLSGLAGTLKTAFTDAVKAGINALIGVVNSAIKHVNDIKHKVPGNKIIPDVPTIPTLARGTPYFAGGLAVVGEAGPELVTARGGQRAEFYAQAGGTVPRNASVLVGERGPEIAHLPRGARVQPLRPAPRPAAAAAMALPTGGRTGMTADLDKTAKRYDDFTKKGQKTSDDTNKAFRGMRTQTQKTLGQHVKDLKWTQDRHQDTVKQIQKDTKWMTDRNQQSFNQIQRDSKWLMDQQKAIIPPNVKTITDDMTKRWQNTQKNGQTTWTQMVKDTRWGIGQIFTQMTAAFKSMGVPAPKGITAKPGKEKGGRLPQAERGYRLPGEPRGDHIPILSKGGDIVAIADGGELVVNRHTERRVNSLLAEKGTTLGKEVAGETTPHWRRAARGARLDDYEQPRAGRRGAPGETARSNQENTRRYRGYGAVGYAFGGRLGGVPRLATGGAITFQAAKNLWTSAGGPPQLAQTMAAIAQGESGLNPQARNPSGASGLWQILGQIVPGNIFDPQVNARNAVAKWRSQGLGAWVVYTQGIYKKYMNGQVVPGGLAGGGGGVAIVAPKLKAVDVKGRGAIGDLGQAAVNKIIKAGQGKLDAAAAAAGGGGPGVLTPGGPKGTSVWKGITMATWVAQALKYAQSKGVSPQPTSGYRPGVDPHTATGTSEHQGLQYPHGAVDFGGYDTGLAEKMAVVNATRDFKYPLLAPIGFHDDGHCSGTGHALGGRVPWFRQGADFIARRPQLVGVGDGSATGERVTITPQGIQRPAATAGAGDGAPAGRPVHVEIHNIHVNRKGDVQKIVDEEMRMLANGIQGRL